MLVFSTPLVTSTPLTFSRVHLPISIREIFKKRRHLGFGVFTDIWSTPIPLAATLYIYCLLLYTFEKSYFVVLASFLEVSCCDLQFLPYS
jgi:hypothetical protein